MTKREMHRLKLLIEDVCQAEFSCGVNAGMADDNNDIDVEVRRDRRKRETRRNRLFAYIDALAKAAR